MTTILIAEDSRTQAVQIRGYLEQASYDVIVAENGRAALEQVAQAKPDIVLTDMEMPEMNGLELVNGILLQYSSIPVVLMTGQGSEALAVEALQRGAAAYIPKINLEATLLETVEEILLKAREAHYKFRLMESLDYEELHFTLDNDPTLIDPLVSHVQLVATPDPIARVRLGIALAHALLNALFRGNLEIPREEQEKYDDWEVMGGQRFFSRRAKSEPYANRKIHFEAKITKEEACFVVRDEGPGFDTSIVPAPGDPHLLEREGGRGLVLMRSFMDEVEFNDRGNEVRLIKRRSVDQP